MENNYLTVQEAIDILMKIEDKSIHFESYDIKTGERHLIKNIDVIYDGEDSHERNVDLNMV